MKYNVHAGHNPAGMIACGAQGLLSESVEDRLISGEIIRLLRAAGHTAYDCTCDNGTSQNDVLAKIVSKCNAHDVDYDFSIHLNSGRNDCTGDGSIGGFEIWVTNTEKGKGELAERIRANMKALGFKDRGTKTTSGLYVLNKTKAPALLLEICFVDDKDDYNLYKDLGYKAIAQAVVNGITGRAITEAKPDAETEPAAEPKKAYTGTFPALPPRGYYLLGDGYKTLTNYKTQIKRIQMFLNWAIDAGLKVDGQYGPNTKVAVERFQVLYGLTVDGSFGSKSLAMAKTIRK